MQDTEHWKELKNRVLRVLIVFGICLFAFVSLSKYVILWLLSFYGFTAYNYYPSESMEVQMWFAIALSGIVVLPLLLWETWQFLKPCFKTTPKMMKYVFISGSLFGLGLGFGATWFSKYMLDILKNYSIGEIQWGLKSIFSTTLITSIVIALSLQLILLIPLLARLGIVDISKLTLRNRYIIFIVMLVIAGLATPPDPISLFVLVAPTYGSFEAGVQLSKMVGVREKWQSEQWKAS